MLSKSDIAQYIRGSILTVNVPEWGGDVSLKKLTATDLVFLRSLTGDDPEKATPEDDLRASYELIARSVCDESGNLLFTVADLQNWSADQYAILSRLVEEIQRYNRITKVAVEELEKNSESGTASDST